jgi:tetratricopeptide (TPR) repeat protein
MAASNSNLGIVAQDREDYDEAERRFNRTLAIFERIGDQDGMATSYANLGTLAQVRGEFTEASGHYLRALNLFEIIGNPARTAQTLSNLGLLAATVGQPDQAVEFHLRALSLRVKLKVPEIADNLVALAEIRERVGRADFTAYVDDVFEAAQDAVGKAGSVNSEWLNDLLDQLQD